MQLYMVYKTAEQLETGMKCTGKKISFEAFPKKTVSFEIEVKLHGICQSSSLFVSSV